MPVFAILLWRQSSALLTENDSPANLAFRCIFLVVVYSAISYRIDSQNKMAFLVKQSNESSFNRWLKIFESFPEGIALVRNEEVIYSNGALKKLFNLDILSFPAEAEGTTLMPQTNI